MNRQIKGITLVALVITIIVLLILAGVSIAMLTGESGILGNAEKAIGKSENAQIQENATLADYESQIGEYVGGTRNSDPNLGETTNLLSAVHSTQAAATVSTKDFTPTEGEQFSKYLKYNEEKDAYEILQDGWYMITLRNGLSSSKTGSGTTATIYFYYNNICLRTIHCMANQYSNQCYDSDSLNLYLKKGKFVNWSKTNTATCSAGAAVGEIIIHKM